MARLSNRSVLDFWTDDLDWKAHQAGYDKLDVALQRNYALAQNGQAVGFILSFPVADGKAFYRVEKTSPLTLTHTRRCGTRSWRRYAKAGYFPSERSRRHSKAA